MPIAQLLRRARQRPLTQAEFLQLMTLLTTQRIISNGLAQLRFDALWPDLSRIERIVTPAPPSLEPPDGVSPDMARHLPRPQRRY